MATLISNKKARLNYEILDSFEAGMELFGTEVKSLKGHQGSLDGAYVIIRGGEAYVTNMHIPAYQKKNAPENFDPYRVRRLLLHKKELGKLAAASSQKGLTIVPISVYNKGTLIKMEVAIARGKKKHDKREELKKRTMERDAARDLADS